MEIALVTGGIVALGYLLNKQEQKFEDEDFYENDFKKNRNIEIKNYAKTDYNIYKNDFMNQLESKHNYNKYDLTKKSLEPNSNLINRVWRITNDEDRTKKIRDSVNKQVDKDLYNVKNIEYNNIEPMMNIDKNYDNSYDSYDTNDNTYESGSYNSEDSLDYSKNSDNDSLFSDNYSIPLVRNNIPNQRNSIKTNNMNNYINDNETFENSSLESFDNINTKVLNTQDAFFDDVVTSVSGNYKEYPKKQPTEECNGFEKQYEELRFDHEGIPGTMPPDRRMLKTFNENMKVIPESEFNADSDGRYGVTSDMTHNNMVPYFKSATYGYNPLLNKKLAENGTRRIELFTGSDQDPNFKHKREVQKLFPNEIGKVESVTGMPNFSDYFESRYIPSQTKNGELITQPIRTTPGLNLGYTESGNSGRQDLYRVMPRNVDQLRTIDNPKVSYKQPIIPGQKGNNRRIMGKQVQQGPDRFYYNSPDSMLPQVGEFEAPAVYGKYIVDPTNREMNGPNTYVGPIKSNVDKSTPEYLQGQFKNPFKKTFEHNGPRNVQRDTRGQIVGQETWTPSDTNRQSTNYGDEYVGNVGHNKTQGYLLNNENAIPEFTNREINDSNPIANIQGNKTSVPLINFLNYIPDTTKKQILIEDNGKKNLTNISNSIKGYLFNSINAIPDETLRSILTEKVILTNAKGNSERSYLFNNTNGIPDTTMKELTEDNLILGNLSNHEQGYLFNYMNNIPDTNLRNIINTLYSSGGLNFKGNHDKSYLIDYKNAIPDTTMRELTENVINLTNLKGQMDKGYLINYVNTIPDTTIKELTENNLHLSSISPIQAKGYLINYINSIPDTTMKELTENNEQMLNIKGNYNQDYMFNYENGVPEQTLRNLIENISQLTNVKGNHSGDYLINYISSIPDTTMKELTEHNTNLTNVSPLKMKTYLINYVNSIPNTTLRELTENQSNIIGQKGNRGKNIMFNYDNGIPDPTIRSQTENQKNIIGQKGNKDKQIMFNYDNAIPDITNRNQTENQKNIIGQKGNKDKQIMFNYDNGIPDPTNRCQTENQKNITGLSGQGTQNRSRLDYANALLNVEKEIIAEGRAPVPVKNNIGKTTLFTEYVFNDDNMTERPVFSGVKQMGSIENELYSFN